MRRDEDRKKQKHKGGFTLLELIVVMAIIAVLAGISVPVYLNYVERAREQRQAVEGRQLRMAVSMLLLEDEEWGQNAESTSPFEQIYWKTLDDEDNPLCGWTPSQWDPDGMVTAILTDAQGELYEITYMSPKGEKETWTFEEENGNLKVTVSHPQE